MFQRIRELNGNAKEPNLDAWANEFRLMRERDGTDRTVDGIRDLMRWALADNFWKSNVLSPSALRKQWDRLVIQRKGQHDARANANRPSAAKWHGESSDFAHLSTSARRLPLGVPVASWSGVSADAVREVEKAIMESRWPIYLHGAQGRGKSCLAALVHQVWPARAVWCDVNELLSQVKICRRDGSVDVVGPDGRSFEFSEAGLFDRLTNAGVLTLDDLGCRTPTDVDVEILTRTVNARAGKPLVVTSNLKPDELNGIFGARLASRLLAGVPLCLAGSDRRLTHSRIVEVRS